MSQQTIKIFIVEIYSKPQKKKQPTNKSLDTSDSKYYGPENNSGYRYVLVAIDNFSKFGWTIPLENKNAQPKKDSFKNFLTNSNRKPNLIETNRGKSFYNNISQIFFKNINIKHYSRNTIKGAVFAERFMGTIRDILKKTAFELRDGIWIDLLSTKTKQYGNSFFY